jgi:hypothetical protein
MAMRVRVPDQRAVHVQQSDAAERAMDDAQRGGHGASLSSASDMLPDAIVPRRKHPVRAQVYGERQSRQYVTKQVAQLHVRSELMNKQGRGQARRGTWSSNLLKFLTFPTACAGMTTRRRIRRLEHRARNRYFRGYLICRVKRGGCARARAGTHTRGPHMSRPTYGADQVARFFLSVTDPEDNDVSNLKLQKLCYYAQGLCTAMRGAPLFADRIEAWDHGPVVPNLYHQYKQYGSQPIPVVTDFNRETWRRRTVRR